jgi:hypothetical protein
MRIALYTIVLAFTLFGMNCNPRADYVVVGGQKLAFDGYMQKFEKLHLVIQSGINKSPSKRLDESFTIGHSFDKELPLNVLSATLKAKNKDFEGQILSTVFSETSKFQKSHSGTMRIEWNFDEPLETLFAEGFSITFKTKLDGKDESATMKFEPVKR